MPKRSDSDEFYVLDLSDAALGVAGSRQYRFTWLQGDVSPKTGRSVRLPVDSYWPELSLIVEFRESQHFEATPFFDKPDRLTASGVHRGEQRRLYDDRREELIPKNGLRLVVIRTDDFTLRGKRIARQGSDFDAVKGMLGLNGNAG